MKTYLTCILILFPTLLLFSEPKEVPRKTFKIIVINSLTADENFSLVGRTLVENDYQIENKDKDFYTIKTAPRNISKKLSGNHFLNFAIKDKSISITGKLTTGITVELYGVRSEDEPVQISYRGMSGSMLNESFLRLAEFAKKLGTEFEFVKE